MTVLFSTEYAFAEATAEQPIETAVQTAVAISKNETVSSGSINATTGTISGELSASFTLQTNESNGYDFLVYSQLTIADGSVVSAFDTNGNLLFGNTVQLPTQTAVNNAKLGISGNQNVIGYKFGITVDSGMTVQFQEADMYETCYKINFNDDTTTGNLRQTISGAPVTNTFLLGEDTSGTYSSTVFITAVSK